MFNDENTKYSNLDDYYKLSHGVKIPNGADLNNYKNLGNYYCTSNDNAKTMINCPISRAFTLKEELATGNRYECQSIREFDTGRVYYRYYTEETDTWSPWQHGIQSSDFEKEHFFYKYIYHASTSNYLNDIMSDYNNIIPNDRTYIIYYQIGGTGYGLTGFKASNQYGYCVVQSYSNAESKKYRINGGAWIVD